MTPLRRAALALLASTLLCAAGARAAPPGTVETFVEAKGPSGILKGVRLAPERAAGAPVALIIPGSGPTDRDGNNPLGVKAASYRLLAEGLAAKGVTTVRIDKRGMFASAAAAADPNDITIADYAADAHAWAAAIRAQTGAPCVWLIGHSEGSLVALAAAQVPKDICGLVLVSGAGRRLSDVMREQFKALPAIPPPVLAEILKAIDTLEAGRLVDAAALSPGLGQLFAPQVQGFLIDMMRYDPAKLVAAYKGPILVLRGTTDLQVSQADAERLAHARPGIRYVPVEGVNHVLKAAPIDRPGNVAAYADPGLPIAPAVVDAIADFLRRP